MQIKILQSVFLMAVFALSTASFAVSGSYSAGNTGEHQAQAKAPASSSTHYKRLWLPGHILPLRERDLADKTW